MFILSKRNIELPSPDGSAKHRVDKGFVGSIPDWAADTAYFRALVKDGKIVVPESKKDKDLAAAEKARIKTPNHAGEPKEPQNPKLEKK